MDGGGREDRLFEVSLGLPYYMHVIPLKLKAKLMVLVYAEE